MSIRWNYTDYTGRICDLQATPGTIGGKYPANDMPMYSFSRAAYEFWNGFANALEQSGMDESEIRETLASRDIRHFLDSQDGIENLGYELGKKFLKPY